MSLTGVACSPEYLLPNLRGIPIVETKAIEGFAYVNNSVQGSARVFNPEGLPQEAGFVLGTNRDLTLASPSILKFSQANSQLLPYQPGAAKGDYLLKANLPTGNTINVIWYYRAYAINAVGTGYGNVMSFIARQSPPTPPTVSTTAASSITAMGAATGGNVTADGGVAVTARGVAYGTAQAPTTANSTTSDGTGTGAFTSTLTGLTELTLYYLRAYATNSLGTAYGNEVSFTTTAFTCGNSTVADVDGNSYNTVQIGTQCWTQSNLKVTRYRNGDNIATGLSNNAWQGTTSGAYAIYNNDPANDVLYGKLYNHYAVTDSRGLCPTGWHVPSDGEWTTLESSLGGSSFAGGALKSTATQPTPGGWRQPNTGATNSSGFTAPPGGLRNDNGDFSYMTNNGFWWSSSVSSASNAWNRYLNFTNSNIYRINDTRTDGFSVRCCRD
jgi:uncharacterized protein (TIGR02145 family)